MFRTLPHKRESYIPKGAVKVSDKQSTAVIYLYEGKMSGKLGALAFHGKAQKPSWHYTFRSLESRERACREFFDRIRAHSKRTREAAEKRKAFVHNVQVGDVYRTSWGYDQTNVEFFEVIEVRGKHAILREIAQAVRSDGQGCESVVPQSGAYLEPRHQGDDRGLPMRRLIQEGHIKIDDVRTAWPWGERTVGGIVVGRACYRTALGWGH